MSPGPRLRRAPVRGRRAGLFLGLATGCGALAACGPGGPAEAQEAHHADGPFVFRDATLESGLHRFRQVNGDPEKPFILETVGGGVALVDYDTDGDLDAYLTNGSRLEALDTEEPPADALYANDGAGVFSDVTAAAGLGDTRWTNGVRVADVDGDGHPDLYLTNYGPNALLRNRGDRSFEDVTELAGVGDARWSTGASFLDFDRDGDLDLYVANYVDFDEEWMLANRPRVTYRGVSVMKGPRGLPGASDAFYINEGGEVYRDGSADVGIDGPELFGFQVVAFDHDRDGWVDLYVANDSVANILWRNVEGQRFEDVAFRSGLALSMAGAPQAGMGVALGDYDGDLLPDVYVTNFADDYFTLYKGLAGGHFIDRTQSLKLGSRTMPLLGWGCGFADFDADGVPELFAVNGHVYPQVDRFDMGTSYLQENVLFAYEAGAFVDPPGLGGPGFALLAASRGAATGDVDGDGDLDLLVGNLDGPPSLLRNDGAGGRWIFVRLVGRAGNRDAVGARIVVTAGGQEQLRLVSTGAGFLSSSDARAHFGLGDADEVEELEVVWPDGRSESFGPLPAGSLVTIEEGATGEPARVGVRALDE